MTGFSLGSQIWSKLGRHLSSTSSLLVVLLFAGLLLLDGLPAVGQDLLQHLVARLLAAERLERLDDVRHDLVQHPEERRGGRICTNRWTCA